MSTGCADDPVDRRVEVVRNLHRHHAAGRELPHHIAQQPRMIRHPLDAGVGKDHVVTAAEFREVAGRVEQPELQRRILPPGGFDHIG